MRNRLWFSCGWAAFAAVVMLSGAAWAANPPAEPAPPQRGSRDEPTPPAGDSPEEPTPPAEDTPEEPPMGAGSYGEEPVPVLLPGSTDAGVVVVPLKRSKSAASADVVRARDLQLRPISRPADLLRVVPGLQVMQHAGGGKANQYYLRGFDIDHGTDLALSVDGVPVNLLSHAHGQGYADLHWLIPELVDRMEVVKGPYEVRNGDLATAGAVEFVVRPTVERNEVSYSLGRFGRQRGLLVVSPSWDGGSLLFGADVEAFDGPFEHPDDSTRFSSMAKLTLRPWIDTTLAVGLTAYANTWSASGQIPQRLVASGQLSRFGSIDASEGGGSQRYSAYVSLKHRMGDAKLDALAYVAVSKLQLFSNFTFFLDDPDRGDQIEQVDERTLMGAKLSWSQPWSFENGMRLRVSAGLDSRFDLARAALFHDEARERLETRVDANIHQAGVGSWVELDATLAEWARLVVATRLDYLHFSVEPSTGGPRGELIASPKATLVFTPHRSTDLFLNFGAGYHSNDARAVVQGGTPSARALGGEFGVRTRLFERLDLSVAAYALHLEEELIWSGDAGSTEPSGETLRLGVELEARVKVLDWLYVDADFTWNRGRLLGEPAGANYIPLAPEFTAQGGVSLHHPLGIYARAGARWLSGRPADESDRLTAEGAVVVDASVGYQHRWFEVRLEVENLLNADYREAQFETTTRLKGETTCASGTIAEDGGCTDLHYTPGLPIQVTGTVAVRF